jgi:hypothetical protein
VFERALKLLTHNRETLERAAGLLLERENAHRGGAARVRPRLAPEPVRLAS